MNTRRQPYLSPVTGNHQNQPAEQSYMAKAVSLEHDRRSAAAKPKKNDRR